MSSDDSPAAWKRPYSAVEDDILPLVIGFIIGRTWMELPATVVGKVSQIAESVFVFGVLLLLALVVLGLAFMLAMFVFTWLQ